MSAHDYQPGSDEYECARLYEELCAASISKDAEGIARVCAEDYVLEHMTGVRQTRDEYIAAVLDGTLNYYSAEHDSIVVEVAPDRQSAHVQGRSRIEAAVYGGGRRTWNLQQDFHAEKRHGTWLLTDDRASTYSSPEPNEESLQSIKEAEEILAKGGRGFKSAHEMIEAALEE